MAFKTMRRLLLMACAFGAAPIVADHAVAQESGFGYDSILSVEERMQHSDRELAEIRQRDLEQRSQNYTYEQVDLDDLIEEGSTNTLDDFYLPPRRTHTHRPAEQYSQESTSTPQPALRNQVEYFEQPASDYSQDLNAPTSGGTLSAGYGSDTGAGYGGDPGSGYDSVLSVRERSQLSQSERDAIRARDLEQRSQNYTYENVSLDDLAESDETSGISYRENPPARYDYSDTAEADYEVRSRVVETTPDRAAQVVDKYGSIPGGITFEPDLSESQEFSIESAVYSRSERTITLLPENVAFEVQTSEKKMIETLRASFAEEEFGVSISGVIGRVSFGGLTEETATAKTLFAADDMLGSLVFHNDGLGDLFLPSSGNLAERGRGTAAVYFNVSHGGFYVSDRQLKTKTIGFDATLIPLDRENRAEDGGSLPDIDRAASALSVSYAWGKNLTWLMDNLAVIKREPLIREVFALAEVNALARLLKSKGLTMTDIKVTR